MLNNLDIGTAFEPGSVPAKTDDLFKRLLSGDYRGPINLLDMLHPYGERIFRAVGDLVHLMDEVSRRSDLALQETGSRVVRADQFDLAERLHDNAGEFLVLSLALSMAAIEPKIRRSVDYLFTADVIDLERLGRDLLEIRDRIIDEMRAHVFYHTPARYAEYYAKPALFGEVVNDKFPEAAKDIQEAGNCLALGRNTASVFHSMRSLEHGLVALASEVEVARQDNWGAYIKEIGKELDKRAHPPKGSPRLTKGAKKRRDERHEYLAELSTRIAAMKDACRNNTMHVEKTYEWEEARFILECTGNLMRQIAKGCKKRPERRRR